MRTKTIQTPMTATISLIRRLKGIFVSGREREVLSVMACLLDGPYGAAQSILMRQFITFLFAAALLTALSGCGRKAPLETPPPPTEKPDEAV